jgi:hypothetical protein
MQKDVENPWENPFENDQAMVVFPHRTVSLPWAMKTCFFHPSIKHPSETMVL